jgi:signal transduction histidine kinase
MPDNETFLRALLDISRRMAEIRNLSALLDYTMSVIVDLVGAQRGYLLLLNRAGQIEIRAKHDTLPATDDELEGVSFSILNAVLASGESQRITNALDNPEFQDASSVKAFQLQSVMCIPLIARERVLGAIYVENREQANLFKQSDLEKLTVFANQTAVSIENVLLATEAQQSRERIVNAREEERRRIRRDLHDELGPTLAAIVLELEMTEQLVSRNPTTATDMLGDACSELRRALDTVRRITHDLRPASLDELGMVSALQEFITTLTRTGEIQVTFDYAGDLSRLPAATEVALYRIAREALTNVIKHAQATECTVSLVCTDELWLTLDVADNGLGFPVDIVRGIGLTSIRERTEELGGYLTFENLEDSGARVRVELPLPASM